MLLANLPSQVSVVASAKQLSQDEAVPIHVVVILTRVSQPQARDVAYWRQRRFSWALSELRSCVKVEVAVLGFPSLISLMVSVDVKQHWPWALSAMCSDLSPAFPSRRKSDLYDQFYDYCGLSISIGWGCFSSHLYIEVEAWFSLPPPFSSTEVWACFVIKILPPLVHHLTLPSCGEWSSSTDLRAQMNC